VSSIGYKDKYIKGTVNTKSLNLQIGNHLHSKNHIVQTIPMRNMSHSQVDGPISNINSLTCIYSSYFHSTRKFGIIFGVIFATVERYLLSKRKYSELRLVPDRIPCRSLFKQLQILPSPCQYIFSLMNFPVRDKEYFRTNSSVYDINTRNKHHLPRQNANLSCFHKRKFSGGIRIFSSLSYTVTQVLRIKRHNLK
jgi:hypothetical protein